LVFRRRLLDFVPMALLNQDTIADALARLNRELETGM
jgi:hypothetical protein